MRRLWVGGVAALILGVAGPARAQTELVWKWKEGDKFYVQTTTTINQKTLIEDPSVTALKAAMGQAPIAAASVKALRRTRDDREITQKLEQTTVLSYTVKKVQPDGTAELVQRIESATTKSGDRPDRPDQMLKDTELTLHVTPAGKVTKVEGHDKVLRALSGGDSGKRDAIFEVLAGVDRRLVEAVADITAIAPAAWGTKALIEDAFLRHGLARKSERSFNFLPSGPVKSGETWTRKAALSLGLLGRLDLEYKYHYKGKDKDVVTISYDTTKADYSPLSARSSLARVTAGQFTTTTASGNMRFDAAKGRATGGTSKVELRGRLTFDNGDYTYDVLLSQRQTIETKVTDEPPTK